MSKNYIIRLKREENLYTRNTSWERKHKATKEIPKVYVGVTRDENNGFYIG
jgi:hypothetical protein